MVEIMVTSERAYAKGTLQEDAGTHQRKVKIPPSCDKEEVTIKAKSHTHQVDNPKIGEQ